MKEVYSYVCLTVNVIELGLHTVRSKYCARPGVDISNRLIYHFLLVQAVSKLTGRSLFERLGDQVPMEKSLTKSKKEQ